jgi:hypothetical protein
MRALYVYIFSMVTLMFSFIIIIFDPPTVAAIAESDIDKQNAKGHQIRTIGAWVPSQFRLEYIKTSDQQISEINTLIREGINEYYLIMRDFNDIHSTNRTEELLKSTDGTSMKVIIILLPPSEGGKHGNYDWKGWIRYFNSLKRIHKSFDGFAIDDFNYQLPMSQGRTDYSLSNNVEYMIASNLSSALNYKDKSVSFYPVIYIETGFQKLVAKEYGKFISGIILASATPQRITNLEENIKRISITFDRKPIKYLVYTCDCPGTSTKEPLAGTVIDATLSISTKAADGIIIYVDITNPVIQYYLHNRLALWKASIVDKTKSM